jgi:hypothetical protein
MNAGDVPFKTPDGPDAPAEAREFCRSRGLTSDQVKIVRRNGVVEVVVKIKCKLEQK